MRRIDTGIKTGFTLIELSIVLVIIGLIAGGVLTGQELIRAAGIRATLSQYEKFDTATYTFRNKYGYLPGDILGTQAAMFGLYESGTSAPDSTAQGDGDGLLAGFTGVWQQSVTYEGEIAMFWLHLSQAGLIDGMYGANGASVTLVGAAPTGGSASGWCVPTIVATNTMIGQLIPLARLGNGNYWLAGNANGHNYFFISGIYTLDTAGNTYSTNNLTPLDAYAIDTKMDDGMPQSGRVFALDPLGGYPLSNSSALGIITPAANNCVNGTAYYISDSIHANLQNCSLRLDFQ